MAPLFEHYGIQLWTPEVGGRVEAGAEDHEQTMLALGCQSKRGVPAGRAAALRQVREAAGVSVVQRQGRLPVPHGYTSASHPGPARPKNLYVREDQILARLAALAILHASRASPHRAETAGVSTSPLLFRWLT